MHGTDVPAPPHASQLPREVKVWWCHKRIVGGWSPNAQPVRLPWGGSMGSYDFYHGHATGASTDDGWRLQVMCSKHEQSARSHTFGWGNDIAACRHHQIVDLMTDTIAHRTQSWFARPKMGGVMGKYPSNVRFFHEPASSTLTQSTPTLMEEGPLLPTGIVALYPHFIKERRSINSNYSTRTRWQPGHEDVPTQKGGSLQGLPIPNLQTVIDSIVKDIFIKRFWPNDSSPFCTVNTISKVISYDQKGGSVMGMNTDGYLTFKKLFLFTINHLYLDKVLPL